MSSRFWEDAARRDPLWAILSDPSKKGRGWNVGEFFATGRREISLLLYQLSRLGLTPDPARALDFGCGIGRLTQALAATFDEVVGIDISPTMIQLAKALNRAGRRARYLLNDSNDLAALDSGTITFVYSDVVLQHIEPAGAKRYIAEFLRVLRPGGVAVFQLTSHLREEGERTAGPVRMDDAAYHAVLRVAGLPDRVQPGATIDLNVSIVNASPHEWDQARRGSIRVGNHWLAADGSMLIQDDGRSALPARVLPGEDRVLGLAVQAPPQSGAYQLEVDLVHEGITWFADAGSASVRLPVFVGTPAVAAAAPAVGPATGAAAVAPADYPDIYATLEASSAIEDAFPMFGVPRDEVVALVGASGGECVFIEEDERGGSEWVGYRYFVRKRA